MKTQPAPQRTAAEIPHPMPLPARVQVLRLPAKWLSAWAAALACVVFAVPQALAAPLVNNNTGTWTDLYNDNLGTAAVQQTVVDSAAGIVRLATGQTNGDFTTVRIRPLSFDAWKTLKLEGTWSAASQVVVTLLDSSNADAPITGFTNIPYTGQINLATLSATTYPEIKVRVALTNGTVSPSITATTVTWNPISRTARNLLSAGGP